MGAKKEEETELIVDDRIKISNNDTGKEMKPKSIV